MTLLRWLASWFRKPRPGVTIGRKFEGTVGSADSPLTTTIMMVVRPIPAVNAPIHILEPNEGGPCVILTALTATVDSHRTFVECSPEPRP